MRWLVLTVVILQAATCGQSGPLTLPEDSDRNQATAAVRASGSTAHGAGGGIEPRRC